MDRKLHTFVTKNTPIRKIVRDRFAMNFRQTYILCIFMVIILGVYYVWILNANANSGYRARRLELERKEIETLKNHFMVTVAEQESHESLFSYIDGMVVVEADEINYVVVEK